MGSQLVTQYVSRLSVENSTCSPIRHGTCPRRLPAGDSATSIEIDGEEKVVFVLVISASPRHPTPASLSIAFPSPARPSRSFARAHRALRPLCLLPSSPERGLHGGYWIRGNSALQSAALLLPLDPQA